MAVYITIMNVESRKIIGLSMNERLRRSWRGRQYAIYGYQVLLKRYDITPSMSRKGNCYDNAYMESFFRTLKRELVHGERYRTREDARLSIFEYVEVFYNRMSRHSALGYKSPEPQEKAPKSNLTPCPLFRGRPADILNLFYRLSLQLCRGFRQFSSFRFTSRTSSSASPPRFSARGLIHPRRSSPPPAQWSK
jgi:hypothetical protein